LLILLLVLPQSPPGFNTRWLDKVLDKVHKTVKRAMALYVLSNGPVVYKQMDCYHLTGKEC